MFPNGICELEDDMYSRTVQFSDINYKMSQIENKQLIYGQYMEFLNSVSNEIDLSLTINNRCIDEDGFRRQMLLPYKGDGYDSFRTELNQHRLDNLKKGNNKIVSEKMFTITTREKNLYEANRSLDKMANDLADNLKGFGCQCEILNGEKRLNTIYSVVNPTATLEYDYKNFKLDYTEKDAITPSCIDFKAGNDMFLMDDRYCKVLYLADWATEMSDDFLAELSSLEYNLMITFHMRVMPRGEDIDHIKNKIAAMEDQIAQQTRRNVMDLNGDIIPVNLQYPYEEALKLLDEVERKNQRLFYTQLFVLINAKSLEELNYIQDNVIKVGKRKGCVFLPMTFEQEDAFNATLPIGLPKKKMGRPLTSKVCSVLIPFSSQELMMGNNPNFYGINSTTKNMILCDRQDLPSPSGFILAPPGSGKSFIAKREFTFSKLTQQYAEFFIIDPQGEYTRCANEYNRVSGKNDCSILKIDNHSDYHFNPFAGDPTEDNFVKRKAEYVSYLMAEMIGRGDLSTRQVSVIDQVVYRLYVDFMGAYDKDPNIPMPTLVDFHRILGEMNDPIAHEMHEALWTYVNGTNDLFSKQSNIEMSNHFIVFDVSEMTDALMPLGMKVILEFIQQRIRENSMRGIKTYVYIDEFVKLLKDKYSEQFFSDFWRWSRKFGAIITALTQNVESLLNTVETRTMLSNSNFVIMLRQEAADLMQLQSLFNLSDSQVSILENARVGSGILKYDRTLIPFTDEFPKDTQLYEIWNTDPNETADKKQQKYFKEKDRHTVRAEIYNKAVERAQKQMQAVSKKVAEEKSNLVEVSIKENSTFSDAAIDPDEY